MGSVDFDPHAARAIVRRLMLARLDEIGRRIVRHARRIVAKRTGRLAASITYVIDEEAMTLRFGTDLLYGRFVELGTYRMGPRSFIRRTAVELADEILRIAEGR